MKFWQNLILVLFFVGINANSEKAKREYDNHPPSKSAMSRTARGSHPELFKSESSCAQIFSHFHELQEMPKTRDELLSYLKSCEALVHSRKGPREWVQTCVAVINIMLSRGLPIIETLHSNEVDFAKRIVNDWQRSQGKWNETAPEVSKIKNPTTTNKIEKAAAKPWLPDSDDLRIMKVAIDEHSPSRALATKIKLEEVGVWNNPLKIDPKHFNEVAKFHRYFYFDSWLIFFSELRQELKAQHYFASEPFKRIKQHIETGFEVPNAEKLKSWSKFYENERFQTSTKLVTTNELIDMIKKTIEHYRKQAAGD